MCIVVQWCRRYVLAVVVLMVVVDGSEGAPECPTPLSCHVCAHCMPDAGQLVRAAIQPPGCAAGRVGWGCVAQALL